MAQDKFIKIYDNLFTYNQQVNFLYNFRNLSFKATGSDGPFDLYPAQQLFSTLTIEDFNKLGMTQTEGYQKLNDEFKFSERDFKHIKVNLSTLGEKTTVHTDGQGITLLYYPNLEWNLGWGGHTLFLNDSLNEFIFTSACKPNRAVIFDGTIPHMVVPPTAMSPYNRYSFVIQFTTLKGNYDC